MQNVDEQKDLINWFKEWSNKEIFDGKNIKDLLGYDDYSFWWFMDFYIYNNLQQRMNGQIPENHKLKVALAPHYLLFRAIIRKLYSSILMPWKPASDKAAVMVMSHRINWRVNSRTGKKEDQLFDHIIEELENKGLNVLALDRNQDMGFNILKEKRKLKPGLWRPVESYAKLSDILFAFRINSQFKRKFRSIRESERFKRSLVYEGKDMGDLILEPMELAFNYIPMEALIQIRGIENAVRDEKLKLMILSHEYGTYGKAAFIAGKKTKIKTLTIQHGVIHPYHMGYIHTKNEIGQWSPKHCPLADKMAVFGDYTKDFLVNDCNSPDPSIAIVGQPKYDVLYEPDKHYNKAKFIKENKIDVNKTSILVATQSVPVMRQREIFFENIMKLSKIPDVQLLIKPHPGEDIAWHKAMMDKIGLKAPMIDPKSDIFEAINATDIMATFNSTTAIEAIMMGKGVVILNLTGQEDILPFVASGGALGIYDEKDLIPTVSKMMDDKKTKEALAIGRERFIQEHMHKNDGRSTERFVMLAIEMMK